MTPLAQALTTFAARRAYEAILHPHRAPKCEPDRVWWHYEDLNMSTRERKHGRKPEGIMVHVTGVPGGFGASRRDITWAQAQIDTNGRYVRKNQHNPEEYRRVLAIIGRMTGASRGGGGQPYHRMVLQSGDGLILNGWNEYTWHGNAGNRQFNGFAIDGDFKREPLTHEVIEAGRWGLSSYAEFLERKIGKRPTITAHRCYARGRGRDPGADVWREIVRPVALDLGLEIHDVAVDGGRRIPSSWM